MKRKKTNPNRKFIVSQGAKPAKKDDYNTFDKMWFWLHLASIEINMDDTSYGGTGTQRTAQNNLNAHPLY